MMGAIQWIEDLEEMEEEENSQDMKIKKRREKRYRWGKSELFMWFIMITFCNILSFQMMGAIQGIEDLKEMKKKI